MKKVLRNWGIAILSALFFVFAAFALMPAKTQTAYAAATATKTITAADIYDNYNSGEDTKGNYGNGLLTWTGASKSKSTTTKISRDTSQKISKESSRRLPPVSKMRTQPLARACSKIFFHSMEWTSA